MSGEETQPVRWFGVFRSEGWTSLSEPLASDLSAIGRAARVRCVLGIVGGLALPVVSVALLVWLDVHALIPLAIVGFLGGPILAATALIKYGNVAWRYRSVRAGMSVERFSGSIDSTFSDTVTKRLVRRKLIDAEDPRDHQLLVVPRSGVVFSVDGHASPLAVGGVIAETAPLRADDALTEPLSDLERAELAGVMDRLHELPVGACFGTGWVVALVSRVLLLPSAAATTWMNTRGFIVWFGVAGVLLVFAQVRVWMRLSALRSEFEGPLQIIRLGKRAGPAGIVPVAWFPRSGVIWQYGQHPGPARLEGGGLLSKVARKARRSAK